MPSPMPNQSISSGISASAGMARLIWMGPSTRYSPMRLRPAMTPSEAPATMPQNRPQKERWNEVQRFSCRRPSWISSQPVVATVQGAERMRSSMTPVAEPMLQRISSKAGPSAAP